MKGIENRAWKSYFEIIFYSDISIFVTLLVKILIQKIFDFLSFPARFSIPLYTIHFNTRQKTIHSILKSNLFFQLVPLRPTCLLYRYFSAILVLGFPETAPKSLAPPYNAKFIKLFLLELLLKPKLVIKRL